MIPLNDDLLTTLRTARDPAPRVDLSPPPAGQGPLCTARTQEQG